MTTATKLTRANVRARLEELPKTATEYAAAEERMHRLAAEFEEHEDEWTEGLPHFPAAVHYEIKSALGAVAGASCQDGLQVC